MSIIVNKALILSELVDGKNTFAPAIGWDNAVTASNVTATYAGTFTPASNVANKNTTDVWRSTSGAAQNFIVTFPLKQIDYVGVARHNWGTGARTITIDAQIAGAWVRVFDIAMIANDTPKIFAFDAVFATGVRINFHNIGAGALPPSMACLYVGKLLRPTRGLQAGFIPLKFSEQVSLVNDRSESGEFFGSIVTDVRLINSADFRYINYAWFVQHMGDFVKAANKGDPFFFAWEPNEYPDDVGFTKFSSSTNPSLEMVAEGYNCHIVLPMEALAL